MEYKSLTSEELEETLGKAPRQDWSLVYNALSNVGNVVFNEMPRGLKTALYAHYRTSPRRMHIIKMKDGRTLVYLEGE